MSNETSPPRAKTFFLTLLMRLAGKPNGANKTKLFAAVEKRTGAKAETLRKLLNEQAGAHETRKGRLFVHENVLLLGTTSRKPQSQENKIGSGLSKIRTTWNTRSKR